MLTKNLYRIFRGYNSTTVIFKSENCTIFLHFKLYIAITFINRFYLHLQPTRNSTIFLYLTFYEKYLFICAKFRVKNMEYWTFFLEQVSYKLLQITIYVTKIFSKQISFNKCNTCTHSQSQAELSRLCCYFPCDSWQADYLLYLLLLFQDVFYSASILYTKPRNFNLQQQCRSKGNLI